MQTPPRTPTTPPRTPTRSNGSTFFGGGGGATCTPQKTRPRRVHHFFTPQPGTTGRGGVRSWDAAGGIADARSQVGAVRPRDEDEDSVENLRRALACDTAIFDDDDERRCTPPTRPPFHPGTPHQMASKPVSPRHATLAFGTDMSPAMTPSKPVRGHRRVDSTASASSLGGPGGKASATPQPNVNPFASPARSVFGKSTSRHGRVVAHELAQAAKGTAADSVSHQGASGTTGIVRPRFGFRHYLPWERVEDQPEGGVYVPLHQDVNGTVWLGTGMLDGRPYAVKEVRFSPLVDHCQGYSLEDQRTIAADPAIACEVAALTLCSRSAYIQRYYTASHDPLLRVHVIQTQYCARGTLVEDTLAHHDAEGRGSPALGGSLVSVTGRSAVFASIPEATVLRILQQVYQGLAVLHSEGIAHNALHPRAVLVDDVGTCKISQFGSASRATSITVPDAGIPPALPSLYEPPSPTDETPLTRDVYSFAAGMLHLIAVSYTQARSGILVNDMTAVALPTLRQLAQFGYSAKLVELFGALLHPQPAQRLTAEAAVHQLSPPTPMMAAVLEQCDSEAARLRARISELRQQLSERENSPPCSRSANRTILSDGETSPIGNTSGMLGSFVPTDAPNTLSRRARRPTQLLLSSSVSEMRAADGVSPTMARDSVMSPGPLYSIRMHRRHSYAAVSFDAANAAADSSDRAGTATPGAHRDSPMNIDGRPFTALSVNASVGRDPRLAGSAHMNNSFDDTPHNESAGTAPRPTTRFRFPQSAERLPTQAAPNRAGETDTAEFGGTPSRAREDTNIDLFGCTSRGGGAATATPPFMSPNMAGATPPLGPGTTERRSHFDTALDSEMRHTCGAWPSKRDWTHGAHTETADEALRILRERLPGIVRSTAPMQDTPREDTYFAPPHLRNTTAMVLAARHNSLALVPSDEYAE